MGGLCQLAERREITLYGGDGMFVAIDDAGQRIQLDAHDQATALQVTGTVCRCPVCHAELIIRNGQVLPAHFAHRAGSDCVVGEPESRDHMVGKHLLATWARAAGWQADFEVYLPAVKQRADVLLHRGDAVQALEFQCAPLSVQRLAERTAGYAQLGLPVQWLLGPRYVGQQPGPATAKFETWSATRGRELRFVDPHTRHMWAWWGLTNAGWNVEQLAPNARPARWHAQSTSGVSTARQILQALAYRDRDTMAVQALCYQRGVHLAGCPVVVHQQLSGVPGLQTKEWLLRVRWLLDFWAVPTWTVAGMTHWWMDYVVGARVPLMGGRQVAALAADAWLAALVAGDYVTVDGQQLRWCQWPTWFADGDRKLAAIHER
ncbi:competence protein [Lacticaseibacillus thailandensis DSM 22698 = JCM 13996]|uniref:Competence protein n=2 Tax=Lacticaseibacillus thailandensis TaxID=381741 RepID=A0A0R2C7J7_9LACO|nr:competence protein [Lacticaseibacillus thailandensis DSM 22698 = JCM 13996]